MNKPKPLEGYIMCESCGYKAKESEFKRNHITCPTTIPTIVAGVLLVLCFIISMVVTILGNMKIL